MQMIFTMRTRRIEVLVAGAGEMDGQFNFNEGSLICLKSLNVVWNLMGVAMSPCCMKTSDLVLYFRNLRTNKPAHS